MIEIERFHNIIEVFTVCRHRHKRNRFVQIVDDGNPVIVSEDQHVSMNMFGLPASFVKELEKGFPEFLSNVKEGDLKAEYLLPAVIDECIHSGKGTVRVLETKDKWFGVTYKEDKPAVVASIQKLVDAGVYPKKLF